jgi:hypothetical protein
MNLKNNKKYKLILFSILFFTLSCTNNSVPNMKSIDNNKKSTNYKKTKIDEPKIKSEVISSKDRLENFILNTYGEKSNDSLCILKMIDLNVFKKSFISSIFRINELETMCDSTHIYFNCSDSSQKTHFTKISLGNQYFTNWIPYKITFYFKNQKSIPNGIISLINDFKENENIQFLKSGIFITTENNMVHFYSLNLCKPNVYDSCKKIIKNNSNINTAVGISCGGAPLEIIVRDTL